MKNILVALLLMSSCIALAQTKQEIEESFWTKDDPYRSVTKIPEKWKNESAVVIIKDEYYSFATGSKNKYALRQRIMLLDQAAVKEYSEFSLSEHVKFIIPTPFSTINIKETDFLGIKVIKPNGAEHRVDVEKEAVKSDDKIKVAVSNLEVGDIIDYYYQTQVPLSMAQEKLLADEYPIMNLKVTIEAQKNFFLNLNSYNGAPEFKEIKSKGSKKAELTATDIEKINLPRWYYPLGELPAYKFDATMAVGGNAKKFIRMFTAEKENILRKAVTKENVLKYYDDKLWAFGNVGEVKKFVKGKGLKTEEEKVIEAYYFCRHQYYTRYMEAILAEEAKIFNSAELYGYPIVIDSDKDFAHHFMAFLKENKIKYEIIVATARENGPIKDMLVQKNVILTLKVLTKEPIYLQFFGSYKTPGTIDHSIEGTDAYALQVPNFAKGTAVENTKLPKSTYKDNLIYQTANVTINDDFTRINFSRETSVFGHFKADEQKEKLYFTDFLDDDNAKYGTEPLRDMINNKKKREQYITEIAAVTNKIKDKQKKEFKEATEAEYGLTFDEHAFELKNLGRYDRLQPFTYSEKFVVKNELIKSAGQNYVVEIGKLIGQQLKLEEHEVNRTHNIYSIFPRSYQEEVNLIVPEGYTVSGIEKLNKKVENNTGGFISTATIEGNVLKVKAYKYYVNYFEPNSNWKDMVSFLDAAYQFTQEKVLFKKN